QPGHPVDVRTEIVVIAELGAAAVNRHPHPQATDFDPRFGGQRPLGGHGGRYRGLGIGEHGAERIAHRLEHAAAHPDDRVTHQRVVTRQGHRHCAGMVLPAARAALDVGEEQRHYRRGWLRHQAHIPPDIGVVGRNPFTARLPMKSGASLTWKSPVLSTNPAYPAQNDTGVATIRIRPWATNLRVAWTLRLRGPRCYTRDPCSSDWQQPWPSLVAL